MNCLHPPAPFPITALIAVKNEEANLTRCLASLEPIARVVVIDSHSTDRTAELAQSAGCEVVQFNYQGGYPKKRQWAIEKLNIATEWVLLLDADEVVPPALWAEIEQAIRGDDAPDAFLITKGFHFLGRRFRFGGFSHSAVLLFRTGAARFEELLEDPANAQDMEVHERLVVTGRVGRLATPLIHEDFKGLKAYLERHNLYSTWEARLRRSYRNEGRYGRLSIRPKLFGNAQERRRFLKLIVMRLPLEPLGWFLYHYIFRFGFLEGQPGLIAARIRAGYIAQVRAKLYELSLDDCNKRKTPPSSASRSVDSQPEPQFTS